MVAIFNYNDYLQFVKSFSKIIAAYYIMTCPEQRGELYYKRKMVEVLKEVWGVFLEAVNVTVLVFVMMTVVDWVQVYTQGRLEQIIGKNRWRQYLITSALGVVPGCTGGFLVVSLYIRRLVSFGAVAGVMIAGSGDEAFIMLSKFPKDALLLFGLLFICGVVFARVADGVFGWRELEPCPECELSHLHQEECSCFEPKVALQFPNWRLTRYLLIGFNLLLLVLFSAGVIGEQGWEKILMISFLGFSLFIFLVVPDHYLEEHILEHIFKRHIWKVFLWSFFAILIIALFLERMDLESFIKAHLSWVLLLSALVGIIPQSGPHLIFVFLYADGLIPFSILFTSSFVQDGHQMLPLLSYTVRDSVLIKILNLIFGLLVGGALYLLNF